VESVVDPYDSICDEYKAEEMVEAYWTNISSKMKEATRLTGQCDASSAGKDRLRYLIRAGYY